MYLGPALPKSRTVNCDDAAGGDTCVPFCLVSYAISCVGAVDGRGICDGSMRF